jgi:hypothetical protein
MSRTSTSSSTPPANEEPELHDPEVQKSYFYVDTGLIAGNVYLFAASRGLATWFHNCDRTALSEKLGLARRSTPAVCTDGRIPPAVGTMRRPGIGNMRGVGVGLSLAGACFKDANAPHGFTGSSIGT